MGTVIVRKTPFIIVILLLARVCLAQTSSEAAHVPRRLLVALEALPESGFTSLEAAVLSKSLVLSLREGLSEIRVIEHGPSAFPPTLAARNDEAARRGADSWLWVAVSGSRDSPSVHVVSFDLLTQTTVVDQGFSAVEDLASADVSRVRWEMIVSLAREKYQPAGRRTVKLTIHAIPDTRISGLPGGPVLARGDGAATVDLEAPSFYRLRATRAGYQPAQMELYVDADRDLQIPQQPGSSFSVEGSFFNALFIGGDAGFFLLPDTAFLKVGVTSFLVGLALSPDSLLYSFPLVHVNVQLGSYWSPEDAFLRWYTSVGGFLRVVLIPGFPPHLDAISPGGLQLNLGVEFPLAGRSRLFVEYVPMLYLSAMTDLFLDSLGPNGVPFGYAPVSFGAFDFANIRFGVRWML